MDNFYLFLIDYIETLMMHPILKGIELGIFILLWQVIGTFVIFSLSNFTEPLRVKMNLDLDYFLLILSCLTGCFTAIYFLSGEGNEKANARAFRLIGVFGIAFMYLVPILLILSVGIIVPIYSITMGVINFVIGVLPILAGIAVLMPILFFGGIFSLVGAVVGRL
jgi:hypothetical protein